MLIPIRELIERELLVVEGIERSIYGPLNEESRIIDPPFEIVPDVSSEPVQAFLRNLKGMENIGNIPEWARVYQTVYNRLGHFKRSFRNLLEIGGYPIEHDQKTRRVMPLSKFLTYGKGNCLEKGILAQLAFQDFGIESYLVIGSYGEQTFPHFHAFNLVDIEDIVNLMDISNPKNEIQELPLQEVTKRAFIVPIKEIDDNYKLGVTSEFEGKLIERTYWFKARVDPFLRY